MKAKDFVIGKIYKCRIWVVAKIDEEHVVCLHTLKPLLRHTVGDKVPIKTLENSYHEIYLDSLPDESKAAYHKLFQSHVSNCTCDINTLMSTGCVCGWIKHER